MTLTDFGDHVYDHVYALWYTCSTQLFKIIWFSSLTWWRLFQKRAVRN